MSSKFNYKLFALNNEATKRNQQKAKSKLSVRWGEFQHDAANRCFAAPCALLDGITGETIHLRIYKLPTYISELSPHNFFETILLDCIAIHGMSLKDFKKNQGFKCEEQARTHYLEAKRTLNDISKHPSALRTASFFNDLITRTFMSGIMCSLQTQKPV